MPCADLKFKPTLTWRRNSSGWLLLAGRRRMGRVVPDDQHIGMYRTVLSRGRLGDMANQSRAKDAVLAAAHRELEWEALRDTATDPTNSPENRGVFSAPSSLARFSAEGGL